GLGSSIWRKGARVTCTVLRAAGAFAASCDCAVAPRSTPKRGTTDNRNNAKLAGTQNANRRTALLNILSVSLLSCPDPSNKKQRAFFSLDVNLSGILSDGTCAKAFRIWGMVHRRLFQVKATLLCLLQIGPH